MDIKRDIDISTQRIEALTDGVFTVVLTLLVLELSLPFSSGQALETELIPRLIALWPKFYSYILTFLLIGMLWNGNRVEFRYLKRSDGTLVLLNTIYLMFLTLLPFATSLIGTYPLSKVSFFFFGVNFGLILLMRIAVWRYAVAGFRLVDPDLSPHLIRTNTMIPLLGLIVAVLDCLIAMVSPLAAIILLYLMVGFYALVIIKGALPKLQ